MCIPHPTLISLRPIFETVEPLNLFIGSFGKISLLTTKSLNWQEDRQTDRQTAEREKYC
jgi:hypothetical protein